VRDVAGRPGPRLSALLPAPGRAFHFLLATGYLLEYHPPGSVTLLLIAKATEDPFLGGMMAVEPGAWIVPASAAADGLMGPTVGCGSTAADDPRLLPPQKL